MLSVWGGYVYEQNIGGMNSTRVFCSTSPYHVTSSDVNVTSFNSTKRRAQFFLFSYIYHYVQ